MEISTPDPLAIDLLLDLVINNVENWRDLLRCRLVDRRWNEFATRRINKEKCCLLVLRAANIDQYLELNKCKNSADGQGHQEEEERGQGQGRPIGHLKVLKLLVILRLPPPQILTTDNYSSANGDNAHNNDDDQIYAATSMFDKAIQLIHLPGRGLEFISVRVEDLTNPLTIAVSRGFDEAMYRFLATCSSTLWHIYLLCKQRTWGISHETTPILVLPSLKTLYCNIYSTDGQGRLAISSAPQLKSLSLQGNHLWLSRGRLTTGIGTLLEGLDKQTLASLYVLSINIREKSTIRALAGITFPNLKVLKLHPLARADHLFGGPEPLTSFLRQHCVLALNSIYVAIYVSTSHWRNPLDRRIPQLQPIRFVNLPLLPNIKHFNLTQLGEVGKSFAVERFDFEHGRRMLGNLVAARNAFPQLESIGLNAVGCYQLARMFILSERVLPIPAEYLTKLEFQHVTIFHLVIPDSFCLHLPQSSVSHLLGEFFPHIRHLCISIEFKSYGRGKWHGVGQKIVRFYLNHFQGIQSLEIRNYFQHFLARIHKEKPNPLRDLQHLILKLPTSATGLKTRRLVARPPREPKFRYETKYVLDKNGELKYKTQKIRAKNKRETATDKNKRQLPKARYFKADMRALRRRNPQLKIEII